MVEYVKNVNIRYVRTMTFQLHSKFFTGEHVYFTDQHNEMTFVSCNMIEKPNARGFMPKNEVPCRTLVITNYKL